MCVSICYGRSVETIWLQETGGCISGHWATETRTGQFLWAPAVALDTGMNTSFLDRLYKNQATMDTYI